MLALARAHVVQAQPADAALSEEPIMVVTASRVEESASEAVVTTDVITRKQIEQSGARNAAELLEERAGVTIARGFSGSALWLRGLDPEYALILVDGDRLVGQVNGAIDLTRYGVEQIERIEIVRGPGSALYGADAIGGVVSILTREPTSELSGDAMISYGQRNTFDLTGRVAGRPMEDLSLQATGGYHRTDGFGGPSMSNVSASAREQGSAALKLRYDPSEHERALVRFGYDNLTLTGTDAAPGGALIDRRQRQTQLNASFEHRLRRAEGVELTSRARYSQFREQYEGDQRRGTALDRFEDNREHMGQLTTLLELAGTTNHRTTLGLEHLFQILESERLSTRGHRYRIAPFGQIAWKAWSDGEGRFDIVPGVRLDADSQFGTQLSPKLALRFTPDSRFELRASYGRGFRAPSFQELLLRFENPTVGYVVGGNPNLQAETSHGVDAGIVWKPLSNIELTTTFFRNDIRNMIAITSQDPGSASSFGMRYGYSNLTHAYTMGLESSADVRFARIFSLQAGHTLLYSWDGEENREIEGRPRHRISVNLRVAHPTWGTALLLRAAVQLRRVYFPQDEAGNAVRKLAPALWNVDVRASQPITKFAEVSVGIENLLDVHDDFMVVLPFTLSASLRGNY
jgi:outer membrane receptor for ferrienterochelin and colicins